MLQRVQPFFKFVLTKIFHLILKSNLLSFNFQIYLDRVVLIFYLKLSKEQLCLIYLLLNVKPVDPTCCFVLSAVFTFILYITFCNKNVSSTTHFSLELHSLVYVLSSSNIFRLCNIIWLFMVGMHEYDNFQLKMLWYGCVESKYRQIISKNRLPIFCLSRCTKRWGEVQEFFIHLVLPLLFPALCSKSCLWPNLINPS